MDKKRLLSISSIPSEERKERKRQDRESSPLSPEGPTRPSAGGGLACSGKSYVLLLILFQRWPELEPHSAFGWKSPVVGAEAGSKGRSKVCAYLELKTSGCFCPPGPGEGDGPCPLAVACSWNCQIRSEGPGTSAISDKWYG